MALLARAHSRRPAQRELADSRRGAYPLGTSRTLQTGPMVEALGELDARALAGAFGSPDCGDDSRAVFVGRTDAHCRRSGARAARNRSLHIAPAGTLT